MERCSSIHRRTAETDIRVSLDLDGSGIYTVQTGIPFLDHMLSMVARHGFYDLEVHATGPRRRLPSHGGGRGHLPGAGLPPGHGE